MKRFFRFLTLCLVSCMAMTSCDSAEDADTVFKQNVSKCFVYVNNLVDGTNAYYKNVNYSIDLNLSKLTANITISGLQLTNGSEYPTFTLRDVPLRNENAGWFDISADEVTHITGLATTPVITNFKLRMLWRVKDNAFDPAFVVRMTVDRRYSITSALPTQSIEGTTTSTGIDGSKYTTTKTNYQLDFNVDTRCVTIKVNKAAFLAGMPQMDIVFPNVPFTISSGKAVFNTESLTPYIGNTPYENFPITDLEGTLDFGNGMDFEFTCAPGSVPGSKFVVDFDGDYAFVAE